MWAVAPRGVREAQDGSQGKVFPQRELGTAQAPQECSRRVWHHSQSGVMGSVQGQELDPVILVISSSEYSTTL